MVRMAGGFNEEIERIKQEVSIKDLVESYGVELKKKGKDLVGLCPMHNDRSPSLVVTPDKHLWHCLGACQTGGSVIDWVMKREGVSLRHAVEILKARMGNTANAKVVTEPLSARPVKHCTVRKLKAPFGSSIEGQELLKRVADFYNESLKESIAGKDYLEKRGLKNSEIIDYFKLGYANRTLCYRLPEKNRKRGAELRRNLRELGILRESGHEHFRGSLVIPIFDEKGDVKEMYGRKLRDNLRKGTAYHLYLPGPHRGVWNISCLAAGKEIILCESLIDALTFWCYGFRNVTSSYGINGFTPDHMEAFKRYGTDRVLIAYDNDEAGNKAAESLAANLLAEGIECFRIQFPAGMDANQCAQRFKNVEKAFKQLLKDAIWKGKITQSVTIGEAKSVNGPGKARPVAAPVAPTAPKGEESPQALSPIPKAAKENPAANEEEEKPLILLAPSAPSDPEKENRDEIAVEKKAKEITVQLGNRYWRFRGLSRNMSYEILKINAMIRKGDKYYIDTLDLYQARQRASFIKQAALEVGENEEVIKIDVGKMLLKLEEFQDEQIKKALEPDNKEKEVVLSQAEKREALDLLKAPNLLERILRDFRTCGLVGEETNKLVGYLAAVSRKLDRPLAVLIQSSSAAGKTWLMESVLSFVPEEERIKYSAMTGQSLFYMGESNIKHKILAIVEEEGAHRTSYALKLLQSEGELSIASTGKDPVTSQLTTKEYRVEGPVMIFSTTTNIDIDEELQNRCIILTVDESREQTKAIHQMQREQRTLEGIRAKKEKEKLLKLHRNAQRLLRPLSILNPYAKRLTFLDDKTRTRRDHNKYLSLIDAIAFLNQYQRSIKSTGYGDNGKPDRYVIVSLEDIELANRLADDVLGRTLDELPPQTRRLLMLIEEMVNKVCKKQKLERSDYRFTRRQICEYSKWSLTQVRVHVQRLVEHEYILIHRGNRGLSFVYELLYKGEGKEGRPFIMGLIDVAKLREQGKNKNNKSTGNEYDVKVAGIEGKKHEYEGEVAGFLGDLAGEKGELAGSKRGQNGPKTGGWRSSQEGFVDSVSPVFLGKSAEKSI